MLEKITSRIKNWAIFLTSDLTNFIYLATWISSLLPNRSPLNDGVPWVNVKALKWFNQNVQENKLIFEWGSGGSTIFFANRAEQLISVEHNPEWVSFVQSELENQNLQDKVVYKMIHPDAEESEAIYFSDSQKAYFKTYVSIIDQYPDKYFDIIMIDGRARLACLKHALPKLNDDGWIILDNSDRYPEVFEWEELKELQTIWGPQGYMLKVTFPQTTIFCKKKFRANTDIG